MSYCRDFTIGLRETQDFYLSLTLRHWRKGIAGFAVAGALAALLYTADPALTLPVRAALTAGAALAGAAIAALALAVSTRRKVKRQVRLSGRKSYVQSTEINGFGVHVSVGKDRAKMAFENLVRVRETRKAFYLFLSEQQAWILPKAQMEDPAADTERLRTLFRAVIERQRLHLMGKAG